MAEGSIAVERGGRVPPQNIDAEKSVLGSMLIDNESIHKVIEVLTAEGFYREAHRKIFHAVIALYQRNDVPACQHQEHTGIIRALEQGDHETAIRLMQEHLLHIESELILEGDGKSPVDLKEALTGI